MCQERLHNTFPLEIVAYTVFGIIMLLLYTRRRHSLALHLRPTGGKFLAHVSLMHAQTAIDVYSSEMLHKHLVRELEYASNR